MRKMKCTITIEETADGKLLILANIPTGAEQTIAGQLASQLLQGSQIIMNKITGQDAEIQEAS